MLSGLLIHSPAVHEVGLVEAVRDAGKPELVAVQILEQALLVQYQLFLQAYIRYTLNYIANLLRH